MATTHGDPDPEPVACPLCGQRVEAGSPDRPCEVKCPGCRQQLWVVGDREADGFVVVSVEQASLDELDEITLGTYIVDVLNAPPRIVIDVSRATAATSAGIALLLRLHTRLQRANVEMRLRGVQPFLRKTLTMVGLDRVFPLDRFGS